MSFDLGSLLGDIQIDQLEALVETMYLAADADGEFGDEEREQLATSIRGVVRGSPHEEALSTDKLAALLDQVRELRRSEGRPARLTSVRDRLDGESARKAAFGLSVKVAAADGIVRTSEREFFLELAEALEVDRDQAADLVRELSRG